MILASSNFIFTSWTLVLHVQWLSIPVKHFYKLNDGFGKFKYCFYKRNSCFTCSMIVFLISQKIVFQAKHCLQAQILFYKLVSCCFDESYLASFFPFLCVRCGHRKQDGGAERQKRERLFAILKHFCVFQKYKIRIPRIVYDHVHIFDLPASVTRLGNIFHFG